MQTTFQNFCEHSGIPYLPPIRQDADVPKALRNQVFLEDFNPECRAMEDYRRAFSLLFPGVCSTKLHTPNCSVRLQ
jgi:hypothetical protein